MEHEEGASQFNIHPMEQFEVRPLFGGTEVHWYTPTNATLWMALAVQNPGTSYVVFVCIALLCGLGGGNFSASMANISFFFPKRMHGTALGWNAGAGNLGVGVMQAVVPVSIYGGALAIMGGGPQAYTDPAINQVWNPRGSTPRGTGRWSLTGGVPGVPGCSAMTTAPAART